MKIKKIFGERVPSPLMGECDVIPNRQLRSRIRLDFRRLTSRCLCALWFKEPAWPGLKDPTVLANFPANECLTVPMKYGREGLVNLLRACFFLSILFLHQSTS
jgi:hypothetical protein